METETFTSAWAGSSLDYGRLSGVSYHQTCERVGESQGGLSKSGDTGRAVWERTQRLTLSHSQPVTRCVGAGYGKAATEQSSSVALRLSGWKAGGLLGFLASGDGAHGETGRAPPGALPIAAPRLSPCRCRRVRGGHRQLPHRRHLPEHPQVLQVHLQVRLHRRREALQR